jgi:hypothetical protein
MLTQAARHAVDDLDEFAVFFGLEAEVNPALVAAVGALFSSELGDSPAASQRLPLGQVEQ